MSDKDIFTSSEWERISNRVTVFPKLNIEVKDIPQKLKDIIWERDEGICIYCKRALGTDCDHVIPRSHGGPDIQENLVLSCHTCNIQKKASFKIEWLVIAFNHLLYVGEDLDWVENVFLKTDDEDDISVIEKEEIIGRTNCPKCGKRTYNNEFCSDECEGIEMNHCLMCNATIPDYKDFCDDNVCRQNFKEDFESEDDDSENDEPEDNEITIE